MTLSSTAAGEPRVSLRERKKLATRRSLRRHALDLVAKRGFANVTVEDIAEAADVSPRTFFNYFPSKEAALFGADPDRAATLRERLVREAPGAPALEALRIVIADEAQAAADELRELGDDPLDWLRRMRPGPIRTCERRGRPRWRWPSGPPPRGWPPGSASTRIRTPTRPCWPRWA
jgi:AcrR family transcriptional regulator